MSKKMIKRSLVLGALMAFVITGSAMAAENKIVSLYDRDPHGQVWNQSPNTWSLGGDSLIVENISTNSLIKDEVVNMIHRDGAVNVKDLNVTGDDNSSFIIKSDSAGLGQNIYDNTHSSSKPVYQDTSVNISVGNFVVESGKNAITIGNSNQVKDGKTATATIRANTIELTAKSGNVLQLQSNNAVNINCNNDFTISGNYDRAIRVAGGSGTVVNITSNELNISGASESSRVDGNGTLNLTANSGNIENSFEAASTGTINVKFDSGVNWKGAFTTATTDGGTGNVTLNGATWKVTANSNITTLEGNGGKIELATAPTTYTLGSTGTNTGFVTLQIGNATNSDAEITGEGLTEAVESGELSAEEALNKLSGAVTVEEGTATLTLEEGETVGATTATIGADGITSVKQDVNQKAAKVSKAATNLKAHYRAHMNDMNKRMGELRMANGEAGVWTRMVRGESEYEGAKMQYNQYQLGYDEKLSVDKRWTVGAAVTFAEGDGSYGQGSTEDKSTAFAIYGTKLNNDGTFVDLIARYAHLESDMEDSVYGNGDYSTNGMSVSAEFGKRIQQGNGLWIEPQVELTYGTVDSADFKLDKGYNAYFDSMDSFIARVGFSVGKDIKQGNVYARASYLYDFDGETTSLVTTGSGAGTPTPEDFGGGWWEVGVGANINLSKATYIYADVEKTFGGEVDTNWQWNLGVRYSF